MTPVAAVTALPFRLIEVSIIIPVRNNPEGLQHCLEALQKQTYSADLFEIFVVDNASTRPLDAVKARFRHVNWLYDAGSGSYSARNRGLIEAKAEIVAFTDSDCIPDPRWVEEGVAALRSGRGTIVGGNVILLDPVGRGLNVYELIELVTSAVPDNSKRIVEERGFTTTGNVFTYRANFDRWGKFDTTLKSAGDREWVMRAIKNGERLIFGERVIVRHPRRSTFGPMVLKFRRHVGGRLTLMKRAGLTAGQVLRELFELSLLDPKVYIIPFKLPHIKGAKMRLHFIGMALLVSVIITTEKIRVFLGGSTSRG